MGKNKRRRLLDAAVKESPTCAVPAEVLNRSSRGSPAGAIRRFPRRERTPARLKRGNLAKVALVQRTYDQFEHCRGQLAQSLE